MLMLVGVNIQPLFFNHSLPWCLLPLQQHRLSLCVVSQLVATSRVIAITLPLSTVDVQSVNASDD